MNTSNRRRFLIPVCQFALLPSTYRFGLDNNQKQTLVLGVGALGREICEELQWMTFAGRVQTIMVPSAADLGNIDRSCNADRVFVLSRLDEVLTRTTIDALKRYRPGSISALMRRPYDCEGAKRLSISEENLATLKRLTSDIQIIHSEASQYANLVGPSGYIPLCDIQGVDKQKLLEELISRIS